MPLPANVLRSYGGGAVVAQLVQEIGPSDTSFTITPTTGWTEADGNPLGTVGPFTVVIDRFTTSVEKIMCSAINLSTGVVTVETSGGSGRGYDGTSPQAHVPGGSTSGVQTCWSSIEAAEANKLVYEIIGQITTAGQILYATGAGTLVALNIGAAGAILDSSGTAPQWLPIGTTGQALQVSGGLPVWANVPGITGTFHSGSVSSVGSTGSTQTLITTPSFGTGTWLVNGAFDWTTGGSGSANLSIVAGTATATFTGAANNGVATGTGQGAFTCIASVTVAGTLLLQGLAGNSGTWGLTGYTAVQIA